MKYRIDALYDCTDCYDDPAFIGYVVSEVVSASVRNVHTSFRIDFAKETDTIVQFMHAKECCEKLNAEA